MKKLFKVETNAFTEFVTYDEEEKVARVLYNEETNSGLDIREVEDDSSWEVYEDVDDIDEFLGIDYNDPDTARIIDEIEIKF